MADANCEVTYTPEDNCCAVLAAPISEPEPPPVQEPTPPPDEPDVPVTCACPSFSITWNDHAPRAYPLDIPLSRPLISGGQAPGGRFTIVISFPLEWKAFEWWVEDPSANGGDLQGYQHSQHDMWNPGGSDYTVDPANSDARSIDALRLVDLSDEDVANPHTIYVSSFPSERRILKVKAYSVIDSGVPSEEIETFTFELVPPPICSVEVESYSPEGHFSTRFRKLSFGTSPVIIPRQSFISVDEALSDISFRTGGFEWPNDTERFKPHFFGRDVWIFRAALDINDFNTFYIPDDVQWDGQGQWRRITSVGHNEDGDGIINYEFPFNPPLSDTDAVSIVDRAIMVRISETEGASAIHDISIIPGEFRPCLGVLFLDTWRLIDYEDPFAWRNSGTSFRQPVARNSWRRFTIEYYFHNANYLPEDGDHEEEPPENGGFVDTISAVMPPSPVQRLEIRCHRAPIIQRPRLSESPIVAGNLRVEIDAIPQRGGTHRGTSLVGDVCRYRIYVKTDTSPLDNTTVPTTDWPTTDGQWTSEPDETYFVGEYPRRQKVVDTDIVLVGNTKALLVAITVDGELGMPMPTYLDGGAAALPNIWDIKITPDDTTTAVWGYEINNNILSWQSNAAAQDPTATAVLLYNSIHQMGMHRGDAVPPAVLWSGPANTIPNPFTHLFNTIGAEIDTARGPAMILREGGTRSTDPVNIGAPKYVVTHRYTFMIVKSNGSVNYKAVKEKTDGFLTPHPTDLGSMLATLYADGTVLDDGARQVEPVTISLLFPDSRNWGHTGAVDIFQSYGSLLSTLKIDFSIDGLATGDGGKVWYNLTKWPNATTMNIHAQRHQIWGKKVVSTGGIVTPLVYRATLNYGFGSTILQQVIYSNELSLRLDSVPSPF